MKRGAIAAATMLGSLVLLLVVPLATTARAGEKKKNASGKKINFLASIDKPLKGVGYYQVSYKRRVPSRAGRRKKPKKAKTVKTKAYVEISRQLSLHRDRPGRIEDLKAGETVFILGKPEELEVVSRDFNGAVGKERFIRNGMLLVAGEGVSIEKKHHSRNRKFRGLQWCKATVERSGSKRGISLVYKGKKHFATVEKGFQMIVREKIEDGDDSGTTRGKLLRRGARVVVAADDRTPRFKGKKEPTKDEIRTYRATKVVVVDRATSALYGDVLPLE